VWLSSIPEKMSPVPQRKTDGGFDEKKFNEIQMAGFDGFGGFGGGGYFYFVLRKRPFLRSQSSNT